jgi:DNA-directed RNA polymerases I and III subunit RPAC2
VAARHFIEGRTNIRVEGTTAVDALEKGFNDLMDLCDVVSEKFQEERLNFMDQMKA